MCRNGWQMNLFSGKYSYPWFIFSAANEVAGRYYFHRRVSFCPRRGVCLPTWDRQPSQKEEPPSEGRPPTLHPHCILHHSAYFNIYLWFSPSGIIWKKNLFNILYYCALYILFHFVDMSLNKTFVYCSTDRTGYFILYFYLGITFRKCL